VVKRRVLLSARDLGGARIVARLARLLGQDQRLDVRVAAQGAAVDMMRASGLSPKVVSALALPDARSGGRGLLFGEVSSLLEEVRPDAVLTSLSGPGLGVDEALVYLAGPRPVFTVQDYEGWVVNGFDRPARHYLVPNEAAARLTSRHAGLVAHVVGDLRHMDYLGIDVLRLREAGRASFAERRLVTFYGQPAWGFHGYQETIAVLAKAASRMPDIRFLYRPHPKETKAEQARVHEMFENAGGAVGRCPGETIAASLAMTDMSLSVFSMVGNDHVNLQSQATAPIGTAAYLLWHESIRSLLVADTGMDRPVVVSEGLVDCALREHDVSDLLRRGLTSDAARRSWERARRRVRPVAEIRTTIADLVLSAIAARDQARPIEV
jgi:hypothetical protein